MTFDVFLSAYGAEAGDLALTLFATGGVYVGGGIARKNLSLIKSGPFIDAFLDKGRFRSLLERIPVWAVVNEDVEIIGAAGFAEQAARENNSPIIYHRYVTGGTHATNLNQRDVRKGLSRGVCRRGV